MLTGMILWLLSVQGMDCGTMVCNIHNSKDNRYHYVMVCDPNLKPGRFQNLTGRITFLWDDGSGVIDLIDIPVKPKACQDV